MKVTGFLRAAVLAGAAVVGSVAASQAATCMYGTQGQYSLSADVWTTTACIGQVVGNDSDHTAGAGVVNVNTLGGTGAFNVSNWSLDSRFDANGTYSPSGLLNISNLSGNLKSGSWSVSSWSGVGMAMLVLKGSNHFAAYLIDMTAGTAGQWITQALVNNGGRTPAISHISLYTTPAPVPVPAAGVLLVGALGGLAALRRRRKSA